MKLPNAERAFVDIAKLRDYALNAEHKEGKHKARVFAAASGLRANDAQWLREKLFEHREERRLPAGKANDYGQRYLIDFELSHARKSARIRSAWIVRNRENFPRLVTCYML
jgi:hypothetical protein